MRMIDMDTAISQGTLDVSYIRALFGPSETSLDC